MAGVLALSAIAAFTFWPRHGGAPPGHHGQTSTSPSATATTLQPAGATGFDPLSKNDPGNENTQYAHFAIDNSPTTAWQSQWYRSAQFGGLKAGSGLIIDMGKQVRFGSVAVNFGPIPGGDVRLLVGNSSDRTPANLASMKTVASANNVSGTVTFHAVASATGRFLVIWFTKLPPAPHSGDKWMAQIFNVVVEGTVVSA